VKVIITDRVGNIPDHVKEYAEDKASNLRHFYDGTMKVEVVFKSDGQSSVAEMIVSVRRGTRLFAEASAKDFQSVLDVLSSKMERQIRKVKEKLRGRKRGGPSTVPPESPRPEEEETEVTYEDIINDMDIG
jgi:putative sigma-54 modulation protein